MPQALGVSIKQKQESEKIDLSLKGIVKICKGDKLYAASTLLSLSYIAYGVMNGCVTGSFDQFKYGKGLFGMCNLIKGNLSNDNDLSKVCIKLGSVLSIASFLFPSERSSIILPKDDYTLKCRIESPSVLNLFKKSLGLS